VGAVTWHGKRDVRADTVPDPRIQDPTDVIVRITSTGICGSDLHLYEVLGPFLDEGDILGHEPMGVVAEVGPQVTEVGVGDRVVVRSTSPASYAPRACIRNVRPARSVSRATGAHCSATGAWVTQQARNLLMDLGGIIKTPAQAPRANAIAERWIRSLRRECLDQMLITGPRHLAHVIREYCQHYNTHRPHRSLHQHPPTGRLATAPHGLQNRPLRRDRLGGLIHEYLRVA
jgi:hypothetical protein